MNEIFNPEWAKSIEVKPMTPYWAPYLSNPNYQKDHSNYLREAWIKLCPPIFLKFDLSLFGPGLEVYHELMSHDLSRSGLLIHGKSGSGKTRIGLEVLKKAHSDGFTVSFMDAEEFASDALDAYRSAKMKPFYDEMLRHQILMLDDLGKSKITQRVAEALFQVIDKRSRAMKTTIVTTNETDDSLSNRCEDKELALACIRRLKEFCKAKML